MVDLIPISLSFALRYEMPSSSRRTRPSWTSQTTNQSYSLISQLSSTRIAARLQAEAAHVSELEALELSPSSSIVDNWFHLAAHCRTHCILCLSKLCWTRARHGPSNSFILIQILLQFRSPLVESPAKKTARLLSKVGFILPSSVNVNRQTSKKVSICSLM